MIHNQYIVLVDDGFLKENGKVTTSIERAHILPTKKAANEFSKKHCGFIAGKLACEIKEVYLSTKKQEYIDPYVYYVEKRCVVYGPTTTIFFSYEKADDEYRRILSDDLVFPFKEDGVLRYVDDKIIKRAENKLGDELLFCRVKRE